MLNTMMRIFFKFVVWRYMCFFINALSSRSDNCATFKVMMTLKCILRYL